MATKRGSKVSEPSSSDKTSFSTKKKPSTKVEFHYIKSPSFRSVHVDGAIGGVTPRGLIHMALFSERPAIPTKTVSDVLDSGRLGEEIRDLREGKSGIAREMEVDLFLGLDTAKEIRIWLDTRIQELEAARERDNGAELSH